MAEIQYVDRGDGVRLAARYQAGQGPTIVFLPGYMSDMTGSKATHLLEWAKANGRSCLLLDYSGCGQSEGAFDQGSIRRWAADAKAVVDALAPGPLLLVGSSMGGWIMLHLALLEPARVIGLVGIAPAPDFTRWGLEMTDADIEEMAHSGFVTRPSEYSEEGYRYCASLIEDADGACLLDNPIAIHCPVRLLHGQLDDAVPWEISVRIMDRVQSEDVQLTLVKGGDHRLSGPAELALLETTVSELLS